MNEHEERKEVKEYKKKKMLKKYMRRSKIRDHIRSSEYYTSYQIKKKKLGWQK